MKLVEILARELEVWPEFRTRFGQLSNGELIADGIACTLRATLAEDWEAACITRPQWQAERDRMKAMEFIDRTPQALLDQLQRLNEPTYEQQLWDRVAASVAPAVYADAMSEFTKTGCPCEDWRDYVASDICSMADAFMAERAKRGEK